MQPILGLLMWVRDKHGRACGGAHNREEMNLAELQSETKPPAYSPLRVPETDRSIVQTRRVRRRVVKCGKHVYTVKVSV